jgi:hypothetical protein
LGVAEGGHGPFRGLDAPFALVITLSEGFCQSQSPGPMQGSEQGFMKLQQLFLAFFGQI